MDTSAKVLERLIQVRLMATVQAASVLSPRLYDFKAGWFMIDVILEAYGGVRRAEDHNHFFHQVILFVMLNMKNARWCNMLEALMQSLCVHRGTFYR